MSEPSSPADAADDAAPMKLELEPLAPPPAVAVETVVATLPPPPARGPIPTPTAPAAVKAAAKARRHEIGTSVFTSIAIHFALFVLLFLLLPGRTPEPEVEVPIRVTLKDWHWIGDDPEAEGGGPRGPVPEKPVTETGKGKDVVPGFLEDDKFEQGSIGMGGGAAGSIFAGRIDGKEGLLAAGGGDGATEGAVRLALEWLARHQEADGTWNSRRFVKRCQGPGCSGAVDDEYVSATTALALLPFLGAGHTWRDGPWKDVVRRGLTALRDRQRADGGFDNGSKRSYADAFATLALAEAYGLTRHEPLGDVARKAAAYWVPRQSASGGWRYEPGDGDADSSVTGWVAMALASAKKAGIDVPDETLSRCRAWFREHTDENGVLGYTSAGIGSRSLLGVGYFVPLMLGARPDDATMTATAARLELSPPRWPDGPDDLGASFGVADPLHWYYGTLAAFQRGGGTWTLWHAKLRPLLLSHQQKGGCSAGSWMPVGQTGVKGGRVVVTALCALSLEAYYRYPRVVSVR